jgi:hypothetical protein
MLREFFMKWMIGLPEDRFCTFCDISASNRQVFDNPELELLANSKTRPGSAEVFSDQTVGLSANVQVFGVLLLVQGGQDWSQGGRQAACNPDPVRYPPGHLLLHRNQPGNFTENPSTRNP